MPKNISKREKRLLESPLVSLDEMPKMWDPVEGKVMSMEEMLASRGAMVMSDKGSVRGKFRYFVLIGLDRSKPFSRETFKKLLDDDFFKQAVEVEHVDIADTHIVLTLLIAPMLAPLDYISDLLGGAKREKLPLYKGFFISNGAPPTAREIKNYLADFKPSS